MWRTISSEGCDLFQVESNGVMQKLNGIVVWKNIPWYHWWLLTLSLSLIYQRDQLKLKSLLTLIIGCCSRWRKLVIILNTLYITIHQISQSVAYLENLASTLLWEFFLWPLDLVVKKFRAALQEKRLSTVFHNVKVMM